MALDSHAQLEHQLRKADSILIALPHLPSTDAIVSALTLFDVLTKRNKQVDIVSTNFSIPQKLRYLKNLSDIKSLCPPLHKTIFKINTSTSPIDQVTYHQGEDLLQVFVTPKNGSISPADLKIEHNAYLYDLIITVNASDLSSLGSLFEDHKDFFFETPIINVDNHPENEHYGQLNWIDINATSTAEMLYDWIYSEQTPPSKDIAMALLTGMMEETHSFRSSQVTPKTLWIVAELIKAGADYQVIIDHLYRSKSIGMLKLWGHVLNSLQSDKESSLAWSIIPSGVFAMTGTDLHQLHDLMDEILNHSPEAKTVVLIFQDPNDHTKVTVHVTTLPPLHAKDLIKDWQPHGSERSATAIIKNVSLTDAEKQVITTIKKRLHSIMSY